MGPTWCGYSVVTQLQRENTAIQDSLRVTVKERDDLQRTTKKALESTTKVTQAKDAEAQLMHSEVDKLNKNLSNMRMQMKVTDCVNRAEEQLKSIERLTQSKKPDQPLLTGVYRTTAAKIFVVGELSVECVRITLALVRKSMQNLALLI